MSAPVTNSPPASLNANPNPAPASPPAQPSPSPSAGSDFFAEQDNDIEKALSSAPPVAPAKPEPTTEPTKPAATVKAAAPVASTPKPKVEGIEVLRTERDRLKAELAPVKTEMERLTRELADAKKAGEPLGALTAELAEHKKERARLEQELRVARYEKSDGVKAAEKEFNQTASTSKQLIESLTVDDGAGGEIPASWDEFQTIFATMKPGQALKAIRSKYGDNAQLAINAYFEMSKAWNKSDAAQAEDRASFQERVNKTTSDAVAAQENFRKTVDTVRSDIITKKPELYGDDPQDEESNKHFKKGMELAELATSSSKFHALSPQRQAVVVANSMLRIAAHPRLVLQNGRLKNENAALKAKIAELESGNTPPDTRPGGSERPPAEESFDQDLEKESKKWAMT